MREKEALIKVVAERVTRLKAEGERLLALCGGYAGAVSSPLSLLPDRGKGGVKYEEVIALPGGGEGRIYGVERNFDKCRSEAQVVLEWGYGKCAVWLKDAEGRHWNSPEAESFKGLSVVVLTAYAKLLERMIESVRQRIALIEEFEKRKAEELAEVVREMAAEDAVGC
jgi:hypothetical protein